MFLKKKKELKKIQSGLLLIHFDFGVGHIHSLLNAQKIRSKILRDEVGMIQKVSF